jgi:phosphate transport system substrate-binding protein
MRLSLDRSLPFALLSTIVALTACNTQGGAPGLGAMPNVRAGAPTRVRPDDFSANDLHAGGATSPAYAYNLGSQPIGTALTTANQPNPQAPPGAGSLFAAAHTKGTVYYCLTSSGDGRKAFYGGTADAAFPPTGPCAPLGATATGYGARVDPLDFAASDVALESTEYTLYRQNREPATGTNYGEPFEIPVIGGTVVYGYRPQDFKKFKNTIRFSTWTYCAILNGTISDWNDPAITEDNGASVTGGVSRQITVFVRADNSGTSFNLTNHLAVACGSSWRAPYNAAPYESTGHSAAWTYGANSQWPGPGSAAVPNSRFESENQNAGVLAAIQSTPFSVGYVEGAWAGSADPPVKQALLQAAGNKVYADPTNRPEVSAAFRKVTASVIQYGGGSDGINFTTVGDKRPECVLYIPTSTYSLPPRGAYPIVSVSYLLFYGSNHHVHIPDKKKLITFITSAKANAIVSKLQYTPLNATIQTAVRNALAGGSANGGKKPCLQ